MSKDALFNENWYRFQHLKPQLAVDVAVRRQRFRGATAWVLHRTSTRTFHHLDGAAWAILSQLNGQRTVDDLWQFALEHFGDDAPSQATMIELLAQLHEAELLTVNNRLNAERLFDRGQQSSSREKRQRYLNPLYVRFALCDPDPLLNRFQPLSRVIFSRGAMLLMLVLGAFALFTIAPHTTALVKEVREISLFSPGQAFALFLIYPLLKLLHELAHALAIKRYGGEVHELGIALMVLLPMPYVDASAASLFSDKRERMLVSAAGVLMELTLAAVAAIVWVNSQGTLHEIALGVIVIGSISTVLFNGNPLLKFDGYYVLADAIEIPNLAARSRRHVLETARTRLLGMPPSEAPIPDKAERAWLAGYGILSSIYRLGLMLTIAWMLSGQYFFFGILLAFWVLLTLLVLPSYRLAHFLLRDGHQAKPTALLLISISLVALLITVTWLPLPQRTLSNGVVWLPDNAIVRLANHCHVTQVTVSQHTQVLPGSSLFECIDENLDTQRQVLQSRIDEIEARRAGIAVTEPVTFRLMEEELTAVRAELAEMIRKHQAQQVAAKSAGRFVPADTLSLEGRYFAQGEIAAYVVPDDQRTLRVAVEQADISLIEEGVSRVEVMFAHGSVDNTRHVTSIRRRMPKATHDVPSPALTSAGGGSLATDDGGQSVREAVFDVELDWPAAATAASVGSRVTVRFVHPPSPLLGRLLTLMRHTLSTRLAA